ncbi:molybdopterin-dependent oxidoreductase [Bradyrhizobium sp. JYMT SZCCT0428]|uniref:molybdopterin-dependent oxidoreductase n=1 Tax=Bradyrhizobium sp. JYMT SZCCT0428 TaxID=2807673 RepID=UPI001BA9B6E2|nr:molybdopterin-dependent oxidoreductase [Bradyrhizobium sp. JYMT SZCCT0428]MBR1149426.1 molybdopterin-dependent oxidoreductase [Bradyrhizobium sp. JYMT SZCCT0428]
MTRYTASHWGIYEVEEKAGAPVLKPYRKDTAPSSIGLHQLAPELSGARVQRPSVRKSYLDGGPGSRTDLRGREAFVEMGWDQALDLAAAAIDKTRKENGNRSIFGGSYGWASAGRFHHAQSQVHRFLNGIGGYVRHMDSYSLGAARVLMPHLVGEMEYLQSIHTSWDVMAEHTQLFIAFGGVPEKNAQVTAGGVADHRVPGGLRQMAKSGVRFVNVSPVEDNLKTGDAVDWVPIRPNTDTALMLAMAWVLETEGLLDRSFLARCTVGYETFRDYILGKHDNLPKSPKWAEGITRVPADKIASLARDAASHRTMLSIAWSLQRATHGEQPFWALVTLAAMLGQIGKPGGGFGVGYGPTNQMGSPHLRMSGPTFSQGTNAVKDFIPVARIADMLLNPGKTFTYDGAEYTYPDIKLIYWAGGNPYHHHQDLNRLRRAWAKPDTIIVNEQFWTATAKRADIVFPVTTTLERDDLGFATKEARLVAMAKVIPPAGEAKDDYDIFAGLAERLGTKDLFTEGHSSGDWLRRLYAQFATKADTIGISVPSFDDFWSAGLLDFSEHDKPVIMLKDFAEDPIANPLQTPSGRIEIGSATIDSFRLADCPGHATWIEPKEWLGGRSVTPAQLHLISDQPTRRLHSQLDPSPWSREGKVNGREPVYINTQDAAIRGITDGDVVELSNARGRCLAGAIVSDVIMPGVVRLSTGAWYDPDPDTDLELHGNPNALTLDVPSSGLSQGCSAHTCLVELRGPVNDLPDISAFDPPVFA